jgi:hypothetical protein
MRVWLRACLAGLLFATTSVACGGPAVDLTKGLQILDVSTGWFDAGLVNGQNKLVPTISFKLKNVSDQKLSVLQVNVLFKRINDPAEWGNGFLTVVGSSGLPAGATTETLTIKSNLGYTGSDQTRQEMLKNVHFIDARVEFFAKYGSVQWARLAEFPVTRTLITN